MKAGPLTVRILKDTDQEAEEGQKFVALVGNRHTGVFINASTKKAAETKAAAFLEAERERNKPKPALPPKAKPSKTKETTP